MPQPFKTGIDGHQRRHHLNTVSTRPLTAVNFAGDLVQVIAHPGKLAQQNRIDGRQPRRPRRPGIETGLPHPRRQLFSVAAFKQLLMLILRDPHGQHLVAFCTQTASGEKYLGGELTQLPERNTACLWASAGSRQARPGASGR